MSEQQKTISYQKHLRLMQEQWRKARENFRSHARRIVLHELKDGDVHEAKKLALTFERILGDING